MVCLGVLSVGVSNLESSLILFKIYPGLKLYKRDKGSRIIRYNANLEYETKKFSL